MDPAEKIIFRRKRPLVAKLLQFTVPMQKKYLDYGLLTDDMFKDILPEQNDRGQMMRFLELVMRSDKISDPFGVTQRLLTAEGHGWVTDEMTIDLLAERGQLDIEDYVDKEAQMIVHKMFGQSKRIAEKDKADISYILALRYQAAKEALQAQLDRVTAERDDALTFKWDENGKLKALSEKIQTFLKIQKLRLNEHVNDSAVHAATRDDPDPENKHLEYMILLEENVDKTLETLARVLLERETMMAERKKCLRILGIPKLNTGLDIAIESALRSAADDIEKSRREINLTDQVAQDLDTRLRNTKMVSDNEMAAKDRQIQYLESQVKAHKDKYVDLEAEVRRLRALLAEAEHSVKTTNKKVDALGKTRRLGYYHPGWVEKTYEDHGVDATEFPESQALVPVGDTVAEQQKETKPASKLRKNGTPGQPTNKARQRDIMGLPKLKPNDVNSSNSNKPGELRRSASKSAKRK